MGGGGGMVLREMEISKMGNIRVIGGGVGWINGKRSDMDIGWFGEVVLWGEKGVLLEEYNYFE